MLDLPLEKALVAVPGPVKCGDECADEDYACHKDCCAGCVNGEEDSQFSCLDFQCTGSSRKTA